MVLDDEKLIQQSVINDLIKNVNRCRELFTSELLPADFVLVWNHIMNSWRTSKSEYIKYIPYSLIECKTYDDFYYYSNYYIQNNH